jgi:hypothetical protein
MRRAVPRFLGAFDVLPNQCPAAAAAHDLLVGHVVALADRLLRRVDRLVLLMVRAAVVGGAAVVAGPPVVGGVSVLCGMAIMRGAMLTSRGVTGRCLPVMRAGGVALGGPDPAMVRRGHWRERRRHRRRRRGLVRGGLLCPGGLRSKDSEGHSRAAKHDSIHIIPLPGCERRFQKLLEDRPRSGCGHPSAS